VRPEVAEQRVVYAAQAFRPGAQAIGGVDADTQNLGV